MGGWTPKLTPNGWWPRLSADGQRVVYGAGGEVSHAEWRRGTEVVWPTSERRLYPLGWHGTVLPMVSVVPLRPVDEPEVIATTFRLPALNDRYARNGSWCAGRAADGGVVWFNGRQMVVGGWRCRCDGDRLVVATKAGIKAYHDGVPTHLIAEAGEVANLSVRGPMVGYRREGVPYVFDLGLCVERKVVVTGHGGRESTPMVVDGWVWTVVEHVGSADRTYVQGHALGSEAVIVRERPVGSQDWIDVQHVGGQWVVASCHDRGVLVVEDIPDTEEPRLWRDILAPSPGPSGWTCPTCGTWIAGVRP